MSPPELVKTALVYDPIPVKLLRLIRLSCATWLILNLLKKQNMDVDSYSGQDHTCSLFSLVLQTMSEPVLGNRNHVDTWPFNELKDFGSEGGVSINLIS